MKSIAGKVAIVTGSARGIGQGIALRYGAEGAKVVCFDRNPATETVEAIKAAGDKPFVVGEIKDGEKGVTLC